MAEKAGWYPDPSERPDVYRWWNGVGWTNWLADSDDGPPPEGHDNPRITAVVIPRGDRQVSHTARTLLVTLIVVLVVLGLAAAGGAVTNRNTVHPDYGPTPSGLTDTPQRADAELSFDEETRRAGYGDVSVTLTPGLVSDFAQHEGINPIFATQQEVPQPGGADDWVAMVAFGNFDGPPQMDPEAHVDYLLGFAAHKFFGEVVAEITDVAPADLSDLPEGRTAGKTAVLRYPAGAPGDTEFDSVEVIVIELNPAQRAVWMSMVPENASREVLDNVAASRASLRVN